MTKIAYNACFGGFGLSKKAVMRYAEIKGINIVARKENNLLTLFYIGGIEDDDHFFFDHALSRTDPVLIQVIEELGEAANGRFAKIRIVDLPEGTKYHVEDYEDGAERVITIDDYPWKTA